MPSDATGAAIVATHEGGQLKIHADRRVAEPIVTDGPRVRPDTETR